MTTSTWIVPVLIVGGGPVGLSTSILLSRHGIRSLLVERHRGTALHPKVRGSNVRTMEIFRPLGVEEPLRAAALPPEQLRSSVWLTSLAGAELSRMRMGYDPELYDQYSPTLPCGCAQDELESVLLSHATTYRHGELLFGHELTSFCQDSSGVTASMVDRTTGVETTVRASYLIAADGASSGVRCALGTPMPGPVLSHRISILFRADLGGLVDGKRSLLYWINNPEVSGLFLAVDNADRWNFHLAYYPESGETVDEFTDDRCIDIVRKAAGVPDLPVKIVSKLPWTMAAQVAERFQIGRVFLAGDAAHVMPPTGGYGMNTGIQDVHNLAWKLAGMLSGWAASELLDTYEAERLPVARFNTEHALINAVETDREGGRPVAARFQGIGIALGFSYDSPAVVPDGSSPPEVGDPVAEYVPTGRPGSRAPHVWLQRNGERISTLDLFERSFVLLSGPQGEAWCDGGERVARALGIPLESYAIGPNANLIDTEGDWVRTYQVEHDGAVLVRPDGHVAWRSRTCVADPPGVLADVLRAILGLGHASNVTTSRCSA